MKAQIGIFLTFTSLSAAFLFPVENNWIYSYRGTVTIGTTEPAVFTSKYEVFADIHVAKLNNGTLLQLKYVTYTLYNGEGHGDDAVSKKIHVPPEAQVVNLPFVLHKYDDEREPGISIDSKDQVWSANIKKAIAFLFNVDKAVLKSIAMKETVVREKENSGFGECGAAYEYAPREKGHISFLKRIFNYRCNGIIWEFDYSFIPISNCAEFDAPRIFSIIRHYDVIDDADNPYINTVYSENHLRLPGFGELDANYYAFVNQTIKLKSLKSAEGPKIDFENMKYKKLHFDRYLPSELKSDPDDLFEMESNKFQTNVSVKEKVVNLTRSILNRIKNLKVQKSNVSTDEDENLIVLIKELQRLNFFTLSALFEEFKNDKEELEFFLKAVSMTGTFSSLKLIQETPIRRHFNNNLDLQLLSEFPRHFKKSQSSKIVKWLE
ncbi:uncharacterized protein LOC143911228 [Arctopsyche grandis]|uniref:uncharacterized protein LOC143911228 n=1 Tax=Arctopsyche grandis TaxID=121162 RepID=UPI00406D925F